MRQCPACGHENTEDSKFCENCGENLTAQKPEQKEEYIAAASESTAGQQTNDYLQSTKQASLSFFHHFVNVMKKPYFAGAGNDQSMTNAIISMVLFSIFIPLTLYFAIKNVLREMQMMFMGLLTTEAPAIEVSFVDVVIKPFIGIAIIVLAVTALTFAAAKLCKIEADFKSVMGRFASYLLPFAVVLAVGFVLCLLRIDLFVFFTLIGLSGLLFIVPAMVLASYRKNENEGLDKMYGVLFVTLCTFIILYIVQLVLLDALTAQLEDLFSELFYY